MLSRFFLISLFLFHATIAYGDANQREKFDQFSAKITELNAAIASLSSAAKDLKKELANTNANERKLRQNMLKDAEAFDTAMRRLVRLHRQPEQALLATDLIARQSHRKHVVNQSRKSLVNNIQSRRTKLEKLLETTAEQETKLLALSNTQEKLATKREKLLKYQQKIIAAMASTPKEQAALKKQAAKLKKAANLTALIKTTNIKPIRLIKGGHAKNFPVDGAIQSAFNEKNNEGVTSLGITVATRPGTPIMPWRVGRVIYSDTFRDYGHLVIVEHSDGTHALYSGLHTTSATRVGVVTAVNQSIGFAPQTETPLIYLEARKNSKPFNPMNFLKTQK